MPGKKSTGGSGSMKPGPTDAGAAALLTAAEDALRMRLGEIGINELEELRELQKTLQIRRPC
ncbi:MAG TPA: hypothetical protein VM095_03685 [Pyrinomonadaceae bacterium]|nr:hypothetical protein [Pyrinomonadaceae bacterium]